MFTGIVQHLGRVRSFEPNTFGARLAVDSSGWSHEPQVGDSIAVDGCCLTVADGSAGHLLMFDVIRQTLQTTTLACLRAGHAVNLEHAVTPQALLGGHIVQGHIDGVGVVQRLTRTQEEHRVWVAPPEPLMEFIVEKGSIALNGVSLTVAATNAESFEVALIPTTLRVTNLVELSDGSRVNLETDYLAKTVVNWLRRTRS